MSCERKVAKCHTNRLAIRSLDFASATKLSRARTLCPPSLCRCRVEYPCSTVDQVPPGTGRQIAPRRPCSAYQFSLLHRHASVTQDRQTDARTKSHARTVAGRSQSDYRIVPATSLSGRFGAMQARHCWRNSTRKTPSLNNHRGNACRGSIELDSRVRNGSERV